MEQICTLMRKHSGSSRGLSLSPAFQILCSLNIMCSLNSISIKISSVKVATKEQNDMLKHHSLPVSWQGSNTAFPFPMRVTLPAAPLEYGVAMVSRIHKNIGLFCRIASLLQGSFAKETYNLIDPTNCSHPITRTFRIMCMELFLHKALSGNFTTVEINVIERTLYHSCSQSLPRKRES